MNGGKPDVETATLLGDLATRVRLGAHHGTSPGALAQLAQDPEPTVRAAVALNATAPLTADRHLAADPDERIRTLLAHKMLRHIPDLSDADQQRMSAQSVAVLSVLVQDEAVRIRILIAQVLAGLSHAPRSLILALAHDAAIPVSEPILRLSPLLTADDLLALLQAPPHAQAACAIASRPALPEAAAEFIARSADTEAISALLANPSAAIRESTLESLIARAADQPAWQETLVRRPVLPPRAARALSEVVAHHWLQVLAERPDLPPDMRSALKQLLWARLAGDRPPDSTVADRAMMDAALQLAARGELSEATLLDALIAGDVRRAACLLAVAAGVTLTVVDRAAAMRSPKALISLVWRAAFSEHVSIPVQSQLGRLEPGKIMTCKSGFPLTTNEMDWQIDLLTRDRQ